MNLNSFGTEFQTKQREREDIQQELLEQERIESAELREQKDLEKRFRQRIEMVQGLDSQVQEHIERKNQMASEDAHYKEMVK